MGKLDSFVKLFMRSNWAVRIRVVLFVLAFAVALGCKRPTEVKPELTLVEGASAVHIVEFGESSERRGCVDLGPFLVSDGSVEENSGYSGTEERAVILLRNEVISRGGDTAEILDKLASLHSSEFGGSIAALEGRIYDCSNQ